jgi:hypothetical protein
LFTSTGFTAAGPIASVSAAYFAVQSVEETSPERTDSWMLAVCAAEEAVDADDVCRRGDRAAGALDEEVRAGADGRPRWRDLREDRLVKNRACGSELGRAQEQRRQQSHRCRAA